MRRIAMAILTAIAMVASLSVTAGPSMAAARVSPADRVTISDYARVGLPLKATLYVNGIDCSSGDCGHVSYQWMLNGKKVRGATGEIFMLKRAHKGKKVSVYADVTWNPYNTYAATSRKLLVRASDYVAVVRNTKAKSCPSKKQIVSAVRKGIKNRKLYGPIPWAELDTCARGFAGIGVIGTRGDREYGPISDAYVALLKRSGKVWKVVDLSTYCSKGRLPKHVYKRVCTVS